MLLSLFHQLLEQAPNRLSGLLRTFQHKLDSIDEPREDWAGLCLNNSNSLEHRSRTSCES
ncbi:hypothetical protein GQ53DRAFT_99931 [Thozetella sp. PMI_491]|nr:hypothetical protein GQ53DRAFT_99931 [Thozetella sp. PMI_491]